MAVFGLLKDVQRLFSNNPSFHAAFEYIKAIETSGSEENLRLSRTPIGAFEKHFLSESCFALEQVYYSKDRSEAFFESHRKYIDVQYIFKGEEIIEVSWASSLKVDVAYDSNRDLIKYHDLEKGSLLKLNAGYVAVLFPEDGHMPGLILNEKMVVFKTVVKVPAV